MSKSTEQMAHEFCNAIDLINRKVQGPEHLKSAIRRGLAEYHMSEAWNEARMTCDRCFQCGLLYTECICPDGEDLP
jgi:hypothetical protein